MRNDISKRLKLACLGAAVALVFMMACRSGRENTNETNTNASAPAAPTTPEIEKYRRIGEQEKGKVDHNSKAHKGGYSPKAGDAPILQDSGFCHKRDKS